MAKKQKITVLGSTGSIGTQTLEVIALHPDKYQVRSLTAGSNKERLLDQIINFKPDFAVIEKEEHACWLKQRLLELELSVTVLFGHKGLEKVATDKCCDKLVSAIVGFAGLYPTLLAARVGHCILLANKESLVVAGSLFVDAVRKYGAEIIPIDSEHYAVWQCLSSYHCMQLSPPEGLKRIILTASGGPFYTLKPEQLKHVSPKMALAHPTWSMGRKISIDSATMMNKAFEVIEAFWLFSLPSEKIDVLVHPQSLVHAMVFFLDGSILSQMGPHDMRIPIASALSFPDKHSCGARDLDFSQLNKLTFDQVCYRKYPSLGLSRLVLQQQGISGLVLNAVNEVAVDLFLAGSISFQDIYHLNLYVLKNFKQQVLPYEWQQIMLLHQEVSEFAQIASKSFSLL